ncbi:MAG: carbonic anhydrase [Actinomycetota bacterium]
MIPADEALTRLREGNRRFVAGDVHVAAFVDRARREALVDEQTPFAVILGCSDSRVPAELVFDQGLGDLFVVRVAGNIVASSQVGSVAFACARFGTPLVVVLGHTGCGAVDATVRAMRGEGPALPGLPKIIDRITEALEGAPEEDPIRANVRASVRTLTRRLEATDCDPTIVGAVYSLETGEVEFLPHKEE